MLYLSTNKYLQNLFYIYYPFNLVHVKLLVWTITICADREVNKRSASDANLLKLVYSTQPNNCMGVQNYT
jgi:hypothetical protein